MNVYQIITEIDPEGNETKKRQFVNRSFGKPEPGIWKKIGSAVMAALPLVITIINDIYYMI